MGCWNYRIVQLRGLQEFCSPGITGLWNQRTVEFHGCGNPGMMGAVGSWDPGITVDRDARELRDPKITGSLN